MSRSAKRVVITGRGVVSSLGCTLPELAEALRCGRSGLRTVPELRSVGLPSAVYAPVRGFDENVIDLRARRTMSAGAMYAVAATQLALADAGLSLDGFDHRRAAAVVGADPGGINDAQAMLRLLYAGRKSRSGAAGTTKVMYSTASANMAGVFQLRGRCYGVSAATATGLAAIRQGAELIAHGVADLAFCGAADEDIWRQFGRTLEKCGEMPLGFDDRPEQACRPFDAARCGPVLSAGAAMVLLESEDHARRRGAPIWAELAGWGTAADGTDALHPTGTGLHRAINFALCHAASCGVTEVAYIHSSANGSRVLDALEARVLRERFADRIPVSSTVGATGLCLSAGSALAVVHTLLMMQYGFMAPTANLQEPAPECRGLRHVTTIESRDVSTALCTATGFSGFNECLVLRRLSV